MKKLLLLLSLLPALLYAQEQRVENPDVMTWDDGGIIRASKAEKKLTLVFTSDGHIDGHNAIRTTLKKHGIKGAFFFTGNFFRYKKCENVVKELKKDGHYIGPHSDRHLLWCPWSDRKTTLVSKDSLKKDIMNNYAEMAKFGIKLKDAPYMIPPYEYYNETHAKWADEWGVLFVNYSPGTASNGDYTLPGHKGYYSSQYIVDRIMKYESKDPDGLNGFMMLIHFGVDARRTDKLYNRLDEIITTLKDKGYEFVSIEELIPLKKKGTKNK